MFPAAGGTAVNIEALSGICGLVVIPSRYLRKCLRFNAPLTRSISIACWIVVYSPQIIENFRRRSADGLSIIFLIVWSLGDLFNLIGGVFQGVLPTMIILALYYTLADCVLVGQAFYYRGFTLSDKVKGCDPGIENQDDLDEEEADDDEDDDQLEEQPLLARDNSGLGRHYGSKNIQKPPALKSNLPPSRGSSRVDATHLSPAVPLVDSTTTSSEAPATQMLIPAAGLRTFIFNLVSILLVCGAGVLGWWIGQQSDVHRHRHDKLPASPEFNVVGQIFGYLCALFYLGSRIPQLLLNYRRKSTEGVSLLFFLFACMGNLTYIMAIFAYEAACKDPDHCIPGEFASIYGRYIAVNASWIIGSAGTLLLDFVIFWQFFLYRKEERNHLNRGTNGAGSVANSGQIPNGVT